MRQGTYLYFENTHLALLHTNVIMGLASRLPNLMPRSRRCRNIRLDRGDNASFKLPIHFPVNLLARQVADARTALEADGYCSWLSGALLLERETDWDAALSKFLRAKAAFEQLSKLGSPEQAAVCRTRLGELEPTLRYCRHASRPAHEVTYRPAKVNTRGSSAHSGRVMARARAAAASPREREPSPCFFAKAGMRAAPSARQTRKTASISPKA